MFDDLISWQTKKQNHVALSSAETEFVLISLASNEIINVLEMCKRIFNVTVTCVMYKDNKPAIELAKTE